MSSTERLLPAAPTGAAGASTPAGFAGRRYGDDRLHLLVRDPRCVLAIWEISPATASSAAARAAAEGVPLRYRLHVERERDGGLPPETIAGTDLPDALGGEGWYLAVPAKAGRCRASLGIELHGRFEPLLVSRWSATPPDGPCDRVGAWPIAPGGEAWLERQWRDDARRLSGGPAPSSSARYLPPPAPSEVRSREFAKPEREGEGEGRR